MGGPMAAALALVAIDSVLRLVLGRPYAGATLLLLAACGISLLPLLPAALTRPALQAALLPALAIGSFAALLITVSIVEIPLTELTVRLSVLALVLACGLGGAAARSRSPLPDRPVWSLRRELAALGLLAAIAVYAFASAWDLATPFQPTGSDVGHYLLYSDEVVAERALLIDDRYAGDGRVFADPPSVGALYGGFLLLDGISSWTLAWGLLAVSTISVLSVFVAAGGLWGLAAGLAAAAAYAVAPIRLDTMYWHGLGTSLALVFLPVVVLALALMFRGGRDWRASGLLAFALIGVAAAHSTTTVVTALLVALVPLVDALWRALRTRRPVDAVRDSWHEGVLQPVVLGVALGFGLGAGVVVHLVRQASALGDPVDFRFLGTEWLDRAAVAGYFSWSFLALAVIAGVVVAVTPRLRRDPAVWALISLALACVVASQLWRIEVAFEYRRVVYYLGIALVLVIGLAFVRLRNRAVLVAAFVLAVVFVARGSVGLRLPERVLEGSRPESPTYVALTELRSRLDSGALPAADLLVTDGCLGIVVPYVLRRTTLPAFTERQVGFVDRMPLARQAATVLAGGEAGREVARELGIDYVVASPACVSAELAQELDGRLVSDADELVVIQLSPSQ
jgi:hypothetical protein